MQLLSLLAAEDKTAFELIYTRYWKQLYNTAFQRLKCAVQAEEIVQEIFIKIWTRRKELDIHNLAGYLNTAVRLSVYNYVERDLASRHFYEPFETITIADTSGADSILQEKELKRLFEAYIDALPRKRREIFLLHINDNLSTKEIAQRLGISQKTVQNQIGTTMQGLRSQALTITAVASVLNHIL